MKTNSVKPSWEHAPDWANWLAVDRDGIWYWYENKPEDFQEEGMWMNLPGMMAQHKWGPVPDWDSSLEERPK